MKCHIFIISNTFDAINQIDRSFCKILIYQYRLFTFFTLQISVFLFDEATIFYFLIFQYRAMFKTNFMAKFDAASHSPTDATSFPPIPFLKL